MSLLHSVNTSVIYPGVQGKSPKSPASKVVSKNKTTGLERASLNYQEKSWSVCSHVRMSHDWQGSFRVSVLKSVQIRNIQDQRNLHALTIDTAQDLWKRQEQLKYAISRGTLHVFLSIHIPRMSFPVYITECSENANHIFYIDEKIRRKVFQKYRNPSSFILRSWCSSHAEGPFRLHREWNIQKGGQHFVHIGNDPISAVCEIRNGLVCDFADGVYLYTDHRTVDTEDSLDKSMSTMSLDRRKDAYSSQALLRILNLSQCIHELELTQKKVRKDLVTSETQISKKSHCLKFTYSKHLFLLSQLHYRLSKYLAAFQKLSDDLQKKKDQVAHQRSQLETHRALLKLRETQYQEAFARLKALWETSSEIRILIAHATRSHIKQLCTVYPVHVIDDQPRLFTIRNLRFCLLPNTVPPAELAAAIGFLAHLAFNISQYLEYDFPYPVSPAGSRSTILDPLSPNLVNRSFPLYPAARAPHAFEHALYLLNHNIIFLLAHYGLPNDQPSDIMTNCERLLQFILSGQHLSFVQVTSVL
ncbi:autophagy specific phophatidylinositol 3-kinase complex subunit Atg14 [Schizosaccharomyces cryophilus OY26]|uniref:Autophagy-related protein 14 n=1 Tax=Schizosaccharomyces cryophilus (strain OY26 / ATCC MYA-4695 / CBS 11777 / NBRC 106824 / NRRL Y48691) TaxID=653667 RepID=S9W4T0_SCHCR|nr:autophagy specific phophatidylinositol 3-kinase complex subunit Atg14 [Schizosaccharomyces cryophilus OY26]EPY52925.1 autophagy specific phophatidylinositol 3-kinase complex subunit Atg14 [Schizosaccharomyces cryophilus OY26]